MTKILFLSSLLILASGCDAPQRSRIPTAFVGSESLGNPVINPTPSTPGGTTNPTTGSNTNTTTTPGFETCDISSKFHTVDIGHFGVCQSSQDESSFKFQTALASNSVRICLIPTYKEANGSSTYLGQPQCTFATANQVTSGKLFKDRPGFTQLSINGVIVMKEPLLPEYFSCMQAYTSWPQNACSTAGNSYCSYWSPRCPTGGRTNQICDSEARNYMNQICGAFKSKYSQSYADIRVKN